jgi:hypothetical protein
MSTGRVRSRVCCHTLLVALAIQGVTPDADDLASAWLINQFQAVASSEHGCALCVAVASNDECGPCRPNTSRDLRVPCQHDTEEESPDEAAVPADSKAAGVTVVCVRKGGAASRIGTLRVQRHAHRRSRTISITQFGFPQPAELALRLCRMTC